MSAEPVAPYKGLRPFDDDESDVPFFFGRDRDRDVIVANLAASRFTVLYGETGVGKSSVLRAGVAHRLRTEARRNADPGRAPELAVVVFDDWRDDPVEGLVAAAAAAVGSALGTDIELPLAEGSLADRLEACAGLLGGELYLILDQTEEFFLYHEGGEEGRRFVEELGEAVRRPGLRVSFLVSLREDSVAKLDRFRADIPNVLGNYLRLDYLDRDAGRTAIVGPIERYNARAGNGQVEIEPPLVEAVLDQVQAGRVEIGRFGRGAVEGADGEGRIETPFLQLVMQRLWEQERGVGSSLLRLETLDALGGAEQIVRDHLNLALDELSPQERDVAAQVFNHLVTPSGAKIAHAAADLATYAGVPEGQLVPVLDTLARERIVRPVAADDGSSRYEIYHDVLGRAVLDWRTAHESERRLLDEREIAGRRHRRLAALLGVALGLLALMAAVTVFAFLQRGEARGQARKAHARQLDAAAVSQLQTDPALSLALAVDAARIAPGSEAEQVLRSSYLASRERTILRAGGPVSVARYSRDGSLLLVAGADGRVRLYDGRARALVRTLVHGAPVLDARFDETGRFVVSGGEDGTARVWRVSDGTRLRVLRHGGPVRSVAVARNGLLVATGGGTTAKVWSMPGDEVFTFVSPKPVTGVELSRRGGLLAVVANQPDVRVYATASRRLVRTFDQGGTALSAAFSPGGGLLVTTGENQTARLWRVSSGRLEHELKGHGASVGGAVFSPEGSRIATASFDGTGRIWDAGTGKLIVTLNGLQNPVVSLGWSPDGRFIAGGNTKGEALVWSADRGDPRALLAGHRDSVRSVEFSPDGRWVLTGSDDATARIWDPRTQPPLLLLHRWPRPLVEAEYVPGTDLVAVAGPGRSAQLVTTGGSLVRRIATDEPVVGVAASPDGRRLAVASGRRVTVVRVPDGAVADALVQPDAVTAVAFSPDGARIATGGASGKARIWSAEGALQRELSGHEQRITDVAFSADGGRVGTASEDDTARTWDARTGKLDLVLRGHRDAVTSIAFSPDGQYVLTGSEDKDARLWDARTGALAQLLRWHFGRVIDVSFSGDGRWILTTGPASAQLWQPGVRDPILPYGFGGHDAPLMSAVFGADGRSVLASSLDGTVRVGSCDVCGDLEELLAMGRRQLAQSGRELTAEERGRYGLG